MPDAPGRPSCSDLPASSSRCARVMPTRFLRAVIEHDVERALRDDRQLVLADLVALRQVRIEVVLAREHRVRARSSRRSRGRTSRPCAPLRHSAPAARRDSRDRRGSPARSARAPYAVGRAGEDLRLASTSCAWISSPMTVSQSAWPHSLMRTPPAARAMPVRLALVAHAPRSAASPRRNAARRSAGRPAGRRTNPHGIDIAGSPARFAPIV